MYHRPPSAVEEKVKATREKLTRAFRTLRSQGYFARARVKESSDIDSAGVKGRIYWDREDDQFFAETGTLYISYAVGNEQDPTPVGDVLVAALKAENIWTEWTGKGSDCVRVRA